MIDMLGQELNIGDIVILTEPRYTSLALGSVIKITKCKICISFNGCSMIKDPKYVIKISNNIETFATLHILKSKHD